MRRRTRPLSILATMLIGLTLFQSSGPAAQSPAGGSRPAGGQPNTPLTRVKPLTIGEKLTYHVSWSGIPAAGRLELEVMGGGLFFGRESYQLRTRVQTLREAWALFGEIDTQYTSYIDRQSGLPHRLVKSIRQGRIGDELTIVDQSSGIARPSGTARTEPLAIPAETFDPASLLTALRRQPILAAPEKSRLFHVIFEGRLIELDVETVGRRTISTQAGSFRATGLRLSPRRLNRYGATLWLSDDEERTPVLINAVMPLGELRAELIAASFNSPTRGRPAASLTPDTGVDALPFQVGERLGYTISWANFLNVGRASLEVRQRGVLNSQSVLELYGEATSIGAARALLTVNDQISSLVHPERTAGTDRLIPLRTEIRLREGRRTKLDTAIFNPSNSGNQTATLNNGTVVTVPPGTLDLLSLFYNLRLTTLKPGEKRRFELLNANHRLQAIVVRAVTIEIITSLTGPRETMRFQILSPAEAPLGEAWITTDQSRLPLRFTARTSFGSIHFNLTSLVGSKN
jgi:hypothetical protein